MRTLGLIAIGILGACAVLALADSVSGFVYHTSREAHVTVIPPRSGTTHRVIVLFPGYLMSGRILAQAFSPFVTENDTLVAINYAQHGLDVAQIYAKVMAAVDSLKPTELRIYGASLGGMVSKDFLDLYRIHGLPFGKVVLILDSAPASTDEVKRPAWLFSTSCWYHGGFISSVIWATATKFISGPPLEVDANPRLVREAHEAGAWAGTPAATSEACFMKHFGPIEEYSLIGAARSVAFLVGVSPGRDPLVRVSAAIASWRRAFPNLVVVRIPSRPGQWHLPLVERPGETAKAVVAPY